ncbi:MAG: hypothetical protein KatS3mg091_185 [Patescibacteria group bacterium]|nr:MAG: hypothetical protein KatS3mg091_185 [Patescibacteria group bacterium]
MGKNRPNKAFTLIEVLFVIIILTATTGLAIANYRGFTTTKSIETELLKFNKAVEYASQLARAESTQVCSSQTITVRPTVYLLELYQVNNQYKAYRITAACANNGILNITPTPINYLLEKGVFTQRPFNTLRFEIKTGKIIENITNACYKIQYNNITKSLVFNNKYGGAEIKSENCN